MSSHHTSVLTFFGSLVVIVFPQPYTVGANDGAKDPDQAAIGRIDYWKNGEYESAIVELELALKHGVSARGGLESNCQFILGPGDYE